MLFTYVTRLTSNEILSPSNKIHRELGQAKYLSAPLYIGLHAKYPLFLPDFHNMGISSTDFRKCSNTKFDENPCNEKRVVPCGQ